MEKRTGRLGTAFCAAFWLLLWIEVGGAVEEKRGGASARISVEGEVSVKPMLPKFVAPRSMGSWHPIPDHVWRAMQGKSWHRHLPCPGRDKLAYLQVPYRDFSGQRQVGELIVARDVAKDLLKVFQKLYEGGFAIWQMKPVHHFGGNDNRSMKANNSSAFNCRMTSSGRRLSQHSYGRAIDINPVQNPYVTRRGTSPRTGKPFDTPKERNHAKTLGIVLPGSLVVKAFASVGWKWGGYWRYSRDYQHFSQNGK